jgi:hypothetical protein
MGIDPPAQVPQRDIIDKQRVDVKPTLIDSEIPLAA